MAFRSVFDFGSIKKEFVKAEINTNFIPLIWKYVIQNPNCELSEVPSLPARAHALLTSKFKSTTTTVDSVLESNDNVTTKLLVKLQVGCKMGCKFCATGSMGFKNNLTSGEIVEQLVHASHLCQIRNIVFMVCITFPQLIYFFMKDFLTVHDTKMGTSMSDPVKRSVDDLVAFLRTFSKEEDLKFFATMVRGITKCAAVKQLSESSTEAESPQQVRVNDPKANPPLFSSGVIGKDNSIARYGIHGLYWLFNADVPGAQLVEGKNTVFLTQPQAHTSWQEIMYDYIRLEGPPSSGLKNIANEYFEWMKRKCLMESNKAYSVPKAKLLAVKTFEVRYANEDTSHSPQILDMDMEGRCLYRN
ncbi:hypothetical protein IFM89_000249 [Coptis chinensis]|uniref:Rhamnogalacturonan lyase domain-containing protein n=1 Tax=Coptis chinensis TaxID=261450 RepID=A0A835IM44_9MAGN|nr:hypothetical protein IFM89_000249 [Coptis chinensis]